MEKVKSIELLVINGSSITNETHKDCYILYQGEYIIIESEDNEAGESICTPYHLSVIKSYKYKVK